MNKFKKEGFTLVELLAVLVILAVIALIAVPIILGIVRQARKDAFVRSTELVVSSTDIDMSIADYEDGHTYIMTDGVIEGLKIGIQNTKGMNGTITYETEEVVEYVLYNKKWCVKKTKDMEKAEVTKYKEEDCKIEAGETSKPTLKPTLLENITSQIPNSGDSIDAGTDEEGNVTGILKNEGTYGIRFEGSNPNNYVRFNGEIWRIIGIVDGRIKIIRNESLGKLAWSSNGKNNWANASLQKLLNEDYYNSTGSYINNQGIKAEYKDMIDANTTWSLLSVSDYNLTKTDMYTRERINGTVYGSNPKNIIAPVGLMYPSDYGFAVKESEQCSATTKIGTYNTAECKDNDWLFYGANEWTILPTTFDGDTSYYVSEGTIFRYYHTDKLFNQTLLDVRPVVNLVSDVKLIGGTGTKEDMYQLSL